MDEEFTFVITESEKSEKEYNKCTGFEVIDTINIKKYNIFLHKDIKILCYLKYVTKGRYINKSGNFVRIDYVYFYNMYSLHEQIRYNGMPKSVSSVVKILEGNEVEKTTYYKLEYIRKRMKYLRHFEINIMRFLDFEFEEIDCSYKNILDIRNFDFNPRRIKTSNFLKIIEEINGNNEIDQPLITILTFLFVTIIIEILCAELEKGIMSIQMDDFFGSKYKLYYKFQQITENLQMDVFVKMKKLFKDIYSSEDNYQSFIMKCIEFINETYINCIKYNDRNYVMLSEICNENILLINSLSVILKQDKYESLCIDEEEYKELTQEQKSFLIDLTEKNGLFILNGRPGTGKSFIIIKYLDDFCECNEKVMISAFQGSTIKNLKDKISDEYKIFTADSILNKFKKGDLDEIEILIIEEATLLSLTKFSKLLQMFNNLSKLILIGDKDQMLSIDYGNVFEDLYLFFKEKKHEKVYCHNFIQNTRFKDNSTLINNSNLIYENSQNFKNAFKYDESACEGIIYKDEEDLNEKIEEILEKSEGNFLFYSHKEETSKNVNKTLHSMENMKTFEGDYEDVKLFKFINSKLKFKYKLNIGDTIRNKKNHDEFELEYVFMLENIHIEQLNKSNYYNILKMVESLEDQNVNFEKITSDYISNGFRDVISNIRYGVSFEIKGIPKSKKLKHLLNTYTPSIIKVYETLNKNQTIITGTGFFYEGNLDYGYCSTIDSVQGEECENCVFIIPKDIAIHSNFYNSRRLLVAFTRPTKKLYILYQNIEYDKNKMKKYWKHVSGDKCLSLTEALQIMSINKSENRNNLLSFFFLDRV